MPCSIRWSIGSSRRRISARSNLSNRDASSPTTGKVRKFLPGKIIMNNREWAANGVIGVLGLLLCLPAAWGADDYQKRVERVLLQTPLIDGHNDLPWELRDRFKSDLSAIDLKSDTGHLAVHDGETALMTDIPRLRAGHVGGQFWSVWIPTDLKGYEAVQVTLEQIDLVKRMAAQYPG